MCPRGSAINPKITPRAALGRADDFQRVFLMMGRAGQPAGIFNHEADFDEVAGRSRDRPRKDQVITLPTPQGPGELSPMIQRNASTMLDLPQPFGPTIAVRPGRRSTVTGSAKLLNPAIRNAVKLAFMPGAAV